MSRKGIDRVPERLINECSFCHRKGIKPGILALEFPSDPKTQEYFRMLIDEMDLCENGRCRECNELFNRHANST